MAQIGEEDLEGEEGKEDFELHLSKDIKKGQIRK